MSRKALSPLSGHTPGYILIIAVIFSISSGLFWYAAACGVSLTYDSVNYIKISHDFFSHNPATFTQGLQPPLFSLMLYILHDLVRIPYPAIQYMFLVINFFLLVIMADKVIGDPFLRIAWLMAATSGVTFQMIHVFLWSEPLFLMTLTCILILVDLYIKKNKFTFPVMALSMILCMERFAGIILLAGIAIAAYRYALQKKPLRKSLAIFLPGVTIFSVWVFMFNPVVNGIPEMFHLHYFSGFFKNIMDYLDTISAWFLPGMINPYLRISLFLIPVIWAVIKKNYGRNYHGLTDLFFIMIIIYLVVMSSPGTIDPYESERYLSVIYPFFLLIVIRMPDQILKRVRHSFRLIILGIMFLWLAYTVTRSIHNSVRWHNAGCRAVTTEYSVIQPNAFLSQMK